MRVVIKLSLLTLLILHSSLFIALGGTDAALVLPCKADIDRFTDLPIAPLPTSLARRDE